MRLQATRASVTSGGGAIDALYRAAGGKPTLDQRFAKDKSLVDKISGNNLITFSRASTGTYVGSDGLIKTSPVNLLTYSNDLSGWSLSNTTRAVSSTNPPFGGGNASSFTATSVSTVYPFGGLASNSPSGTYTFSIYTTFTQSFSFLGYGSGFGLLVLFDVDTKQPSTVTVNSGTNATNVNSSVTLDEGGWYKIQVTFTTTGIVSETTVALNKNKTTAWGLFNSSVVGDTLTVFGAQLQEGTTATDYIPTTTTISGAPRFDHDPVTGESLGLLIEESRTNYELYSVDINTGKNSLTGSTLTANAATAPDGTTTATRITGSGTDEAATLTWSTEVISNTQYNVFSVFVKANSGTPILGFYTNTFVAGTVVFNIDLSDGTTNTINNPGSFYSKVVAYPNGWYRVTVMGGVGVGIAGVWLINLVPSLTSARGASSGSNASASYLIWGVQEELTNSPFPTSYIPTSGTTVTRAADVADITGTNFSSWFNSSELQGTVFSEVRAKGISGIDAVFAIGSNGDTDRWLQQYLSVGSTFYEYEQGAPPIHSITIGTPIKSSCGRINGDNACALNGAIVQTDTYSGTYNPVFLKIGASGDPNRILNGTIARLAYFSTRKTDQQLINMTS